MKVDALLEYYERELVTLREYSREYAERYPKIAGKLQLGGDACGDPHVERMIEAFALLSARLAKRLDDDYPLLTESLLQVLYPHYLRPMPPCAIAQADAGATQSAEISTLARATELASLPIQGVRCRFRTAYAVSLAPLRLQGACLRWHIDAPAAIELPSDASACISLELASAIETPLAQLGIPFLRLYIDGDATFCSTLRDALFMRVTAACVEADGQWQTLPGVPLAPVGFEEDEALLPFPDRSHPAYRLLTEYFAFPEKFNFFDIDLAVVASAAPAGCRRLTLHLPVAGLRPDTSAARVLAHLSPRHLLAGCTPVVNLFEKKAVPLMLTHARSEYEVLADVNRAEAYEVHEIDAVRHAGRADMREDEVEYLPLYTARHAHGAAGQGRYWVARRDEVLAVHSPGREMKIAFVDRDFQPQAASNSCVSLDLTCSNRDLAASMPRGTAGGDLHPAGDASGSGLRLLRQPTPTRRYARAGAHWRLLSHLTLNQGSLLRNGVQGLRDILSLYDIAQSPMSQRQIAGIAALADEPAVAWMRSKHGATLVHGVRIRVTLDETAFVGTSVHLFAQVLDHFFGLYVQVNQFSELCIVSQQSGEELIRCKARNGVQTLV